ncbi:hypothetical protein [Streptomonospora litoralis]|uniref:Uncharacterized protein n=1 Tax=Streptomonospora litoralis TaxID=2498135 RepID=A0A4P6Q2J7_9ACTN|nr:hypothetical protein [Streptomonospora litoralis]QBI53461.1 hypothetical protein EKD16_08335 [Streptomonospora litoralis]
MPDSIASPDWRALVLAHLTSTDPITGDLDAVDNTDGWRLAYATLMASRGRADPPELLADIAQRVNAIEKELASNHKTFVQLNEITSDNMRDLRQRLARIEQAATTDGSAGR